MEITDISLSVQLIWLFTLAIPVACISWTVTHEEILNEPRLFCEKKIKSAKTLIERKFYYLFICEYCFSHYIAIFILIVTRFTLLFADWRGYLIAGFSLVWIANFYMSIYGFIRIGLKKEKLNVKLEEEEIKNETENSKDD